MKSLVDYEVITNEVFYRCWHILDYIAAHKDLPELEREAIQATIMDALVYKGQLDPTRQSLDLDTLSIVDDQKHYCYQKHPNICGIPLSIKEKLRQKTPRSAGYIPATIPLAKPPVKGGRYCVYDLNRAVSSVFEDATFVEAIYTSPTRGVRLDKSRPFVEVNIDGELYFVDVLTKRILKSSWFKSTFEMEIIASQKISKMPPDFLNFHNEQVDESKCALATYIDMIDGLFSGIKSPALAESNYELEQSKIYFPEEWKKSEQLIRERKEFFSDKEYIKLFTSASSTKIQGE